MLYITIELYGQRSLMSEAYTTSSDLKYELQYSINEFLIVFLITFFLAVNSFEVYFAIAHVVVPFAFTLCAIFARRTSTSIDWNGQCGKKTDYNMGLLEFGS